MSLIINETILTVTLHIFLVSFNCDGVDLHVLRLDYTQLIVEYSISVVTNADFTILRIFHYLLSCRLCIQ